MCIAGRHAVEANDPNLDAPKRFRHFLFQYAVTMLHELAHIYITFLGLGKIDTPPHIASEVIKKSSDIGESGRWLEEKVFGGRMIILRNTEEDDHQVYLKFACFGRSLAHELMCSTGRLRLPDERRRHLPDLAGDDR